MRCLVLLAFPAFAPKPEHPQTTTHSRAASRAATAPASRTGPRPGSPLLPFRPCCAVAGEGLPHASPACIANSAQGSGAAAWRRRRRRRRHAHYCPGSAVQAPAACRTQECGCWHGNWRWLPALRWPSPSRPAAHSSTREPCRPCLLQLRRAGERSARPAAPLSAQGRPFTLRRIGIPIEPYRNNTAASWVSGELTAFVPSGLPAWHCADGSNLRPYLVLRQGMAAGPAAAPALPVSPGRLAQLMPCPPARRWDSGPGLLNGSAWPAGTRLNLGSCWHPQAARPALSVRMSKNATWPAAGPFQCIRWVALPAAGPRWLLGCCRAVLQMPPSLLPLHCCAAARRPTAAAPAATASGSRCRLNQTHFTVRGRAGSGRPPWAGKAAPCGAQLLHAPADCRWRRLPADAVPPGVVCRVCHHSCQSRHAARQVPSECRPAAVSSQPAAGSWRRCLQALPCPILPCRTTPQVSVGTLRWPPQAPAAGRCRHCAGGNHEHGH